MKYALLGYDASGALGELDSEEKRALHRRHHELHDEFAPTNGAGVTMIAHYRFRPQRLVTTVSAEGDEIVNHDGPATGASAGLRALYLLESNDRDAVLAFAGRLPAIKRGGTVEVWPITEPDIAERSPKHGLHRPRGH